MGVTRSSCLDLELRVTRGAVMGKQHGVDAPRRRQRPVVETDRSVDIPEPDDILGRRRQHGHRGGKKKTHCGSPPMGSIAAGRLAVCLLRTYAGNALSESPETGGMRSLKRGIKAGRGLIPRPG